jgi:hypothetical protein
VNIISFQSQFLQFFGISSNKIISKINVFSQLSSENCEIKSIISDLPRAFQQHQECPQNSHALSSFDFI